MKKHTTQHLAGIRKKLAVIPEGDWDEDVRKDYPAFGRPGSEREVPGT